MAKWYVDFPDRREGPLSDGALRELARSGRLKPDDQVSADGESWRSAEEVSGLEFPSAIATQADLSRPRPDESELSTTPVSQSNTVRTGGSGPRLKPGDQLPGYVILGVLGAGAMGVVYRARQTALGRVVALKTVRVGRQNPQVALARFTQEAQAVARLRHPNIVTAYDSGQDGDLFYFTMELLDGETLEARLEREGQCPEAFAWGVIRQAAAGLAHASAEGVIHRDVKPSNLFLTPPPTGYPLPSGLPMVKVTDFGLARLRQADDPAAHRLTAAGLVVGTPLYMAPEQLTGGEIDCRADIYALGVTAYEMIAGHAPFRGDTVYQLLQRKTAGELPPVPGSSAATMDLLTAMTATDTGRRLASYEELLTRIDQVVKGEATLTVPPRRESSSGALGSAPLEDSRRGGTKKSLSLRIILPLILLTGTLLGGATAWRVTNTPPAPTMVPTGRAQTLFGGTLGVGWQSLRGRLQIAKDIEKTTVIAVQGVVRRALPDFANYALSVGADLHQATVIELHFGLAAYAPAPPSPGSPRHILRVSRDEGIRLGRRVNDDAPFEPLSAAVAIPKPEARGDGVPYHELRVERQGRWWYAYLNRQYVGAVRDGGGKRATEFRLLVEGGTAHFDDAEVSEYAPPAARQ